MSHFLDALRQIDGGAAVRSIDELERGAFERCVDALKIARGELKVFNAKLAG
jgi:hypothetical protein